MAAQVAPLRSGAAWVAAAWTWFGVASTLLCLSALSDLVKGLSDGQYQLMLGSFGALVTLLYGAPSSPLAQPRNALLGAGRPESARTRARRKCPDPRATP